MSTATDTRASHARLADRQIADRGPVRVGIAIAIAIVLVLSIAIPEVCAESGRRRFGALLLAVGFVVLLLAATATCGHAIRPPRTSWTAIIDPRSGTPARARRTP